MDFSRGDTPIMFAFSLLSFLTCIPVIGSFMVFPHVRQKEYMRVVLYLAISNLLNSTGSLTGVPYDQSFACWYEGIVTNIFTLSTLSWSIVITYMIHRIVFTGKIPVIDWRHHLFCWGLPCIVTFLPFINTTYGAPDGMGWCWVVALPSTPSWALLFWYWASFYVWVTSGVFAMMVMCIHIIYHVRNVHSATQDALVKVVNSVKYYPVIIAACWAGQLIYDNVTDYTYNFRGMEVVHTVALTISCAQGFLTAVLFFVSNRDVRKCWFELLTTGRFVDPAEKLRRRWSLGNSTTNSGNYQVCICACCLKPLRTVASLKISPSSCNGAQEENKTSSSIQHARIPNRFNSDSHVAKMMSDKSGIDKNLLLLGDDAVTAFDLLESMEGQPAAAAAAERSQGREGHYPVTSSHVERGRQSIRQVGNAWADDELHSRNSTLSPPGPASTMAFSTGSLSPHTKVEPLKVDRATTHNRAAAVGGDLVLLESDDIFI